MRELTPRFDPFRPRNAGEEKELIRAMLHANENRKKRATIYNGTRTPDFCVAALALRVLMDPHPEVIVRPIVGQRRNPLCPTDTSTFQQICRDDYILLMYSTGPEASLTRHWWKYKDLDQLEFPAWSIGDLPDKLFATIRKHGTQKLNDFIASPWTQEMYLHDGRQDSYVINAPTHMRLNDMETAKLCGKFQEILEQETSDHLTAEERTIVDQLFRTAAKHTAHKHWAGAITFAYIACRRHPPKLIDMHTGGKRLDKCDYCKLIFRIGSKKLVVKIKVKLDELVHNALVASYESSNRG